MSETCTVQETKGFTLDVSKKTANTVCDIFDCLSYGPAPESSLPADGWLDDHLREFGLFINGKWVKPEGRKTYETKNPATGLSFNDLLLRILSNIWCLFPASHISANVKCALI